MSELRILKLSPEVRPIGRKEKRKRAILIKKKIDEVRSRDLATMADSNITLTGKETPSKVSLHDHGSRINNGRDSQSGSDDAEKAPPSMMDPNSFPEGGSEAWLTVAGCSACLFVSFGWVNCIGVFQNYYTTDLLKGTSPSKVAWIASLQSANASSNIDKAFLTSSSFLHAIWRNFRRQNLRLLWTPRPYHDWHLSPRLWPDDD